MSTLTGYQSRVEGIGRGLIRLGVAPELCMLVAWGMVETMQRYLWSNATDIIGTPDDLEQVVGWRGPPRAVATLFTRSGLVAEVGGTLCYTRATKDLPDYLRAQWRRASPDTYKAAKGRFPGHGEAALRIKPSPQPEPPTSVEPGGEDTMGQLFPDEPAGRARDNGVVGYRECVDHWFRIYKAKYKRSYVFRPKDGAILKRLLKASPPETIKHAMTEYMRCTDPFWFGHELDGLSSKFNRWANGDTRNELRRDGTINEEVGIREL